MNDAIVFLPELAVMAMAAVMFALSMAKPDARRDFGVALFFAAIIVAAAVASLKSEAMLFFGTYRVDIFSQMFKAAIGLGLLLAITVCLDFRGVEESLHPPARRR